MKLKRMGVTKSSNVEAGQFADYLLDLEYGNFPICKESDSAKPITFLSFIEFSGEKTLPVSFFCERNKSSSHAIYYYLDQGGTEKSYSHNNK